MAKTVVITGCSTGFGRATALHLARHGWLVFATVRRPADAASLAAEAATQGGSGRLVPVQAELTDARAVAALGEAVAAHSPRLDALVNNAGTAFPGPIELLPLDHLRSQLEINLLAHVAVIQALLPLLKAAAGTIVNVSSVGGRVAMPANAAYHMSKFGLEAMSDALRVELAPFGVRVVVVEPGASPTAIWKTSIRRARAELPEGGLGAYEPLVNAVEQRALRSEQGGFPPERFAETIERILASRRPRPRYVIPRQSAVVIRLRQILPDRAWDWIVRRSLRW